MVLEACYCNWGIPRVESLPAHSHPWSANDGQHGEERFREDGNRFLVYLRDVDPEQEPRIWVNYKTLARVPE